MADNTNRPNFNASAAPTFPGQNQYIQAGQHSTKGQTPFGFPPMPNQQTGNFRPPTAGSAGSRPGYSGQSSMSTNMNAGPRMYNGPTSVNGHSGMTPPPRQMPQRPPMPMNMPGPPSSSHSGPITNGPLYQPAPSGPVNSQNSYGMTPSYPGPLSTTLANSLPGSSASSQSMMYSNAPPRPTSIAGNQPKGTQPGQLPLSHWGTPSYSNTNMSGPRPFVGHPTGQSTTGPRPQVGPPVAGPRLTDPPSNVGPSGLNRPGLTPTPNMGPPPTGNFPRYSGPPKSAAMSTGSGENLSPAVTSSLGSVGLTGQMSNAGPPVLQGQTQTILNNDDVSQGGVGDSSVKTSEQVELLPVPFHGHGQYSHQVGMALTPGITPNNSEPPSQKSSRSPSPMVENVSYDALEGQFSPQEQSKASAPKPSLPPSTMYNPGAFSTAKQNSIPPMEGPRPLAPPSGPSLGPPSGPPMGLYNPSSGQMGSQTGPPRPGMPPSSINGPPRAGMPPPPPQDMNRGNAMPPPMFNQSMQPNQMGPPSGPTGAPYMHQGQQIPQQRQPQPFQPQGAPTYAGMPPTSFPSSQGYIGAPGPMGAQPQYPGQNNMEQVTRGLGSVGLQDSGGQAINLLQEKRLIPSDGVEVPKPKLPHDARKVNCNPDVFRCTLTAIPQTSGLLNKCRLPLGILIHPFKDLSGENEIDAFWEQLPVIQSSVIVRCRSCRTYINPFVSFLDQRRWKCNLCYRINELPDEFQFDPVTKTYGDPQRRPEIRSATIEFIAPSEYMLRPPQPAVYLFLLDVSFNAVETGYLQIFCQTLIDEIDKIPKDSRTQVGFLLYDRALHFFNLSSSLSQPQMLTVPDIEETFLPCPDDLLVNLQESKDLIIDLLTQIPNIFDGNLETGSALGAALQAAYKLMSATGGRVTVMQTVLPSYGPGALQNRDDSNQRTSKNVTNLGPATDFYKKLALDCSAQQIAVDLFMLNGQYADLASVSCISKYSGGEVSYYSSFHAVKNRSLADKYEEDLRRYLTRKIGFEAVMRIRCTKGLSIHTFHGNFFVRSTDLLSLPNINPDAGFGMQMSIEDALTETPTVCFQAALLYTSSKAERRIRVHTLCVPVTNQINEVIAGADQRAIIGLLAKMACDRSLTASLSDAREALINAAIDCISAFGATLPSSQRLGSLPAPFSTRLVPAYILALLKNPAFRHGVNTKVDDRVFAMQQCKSLPLQYLMQTVYPDLYPVHNIDDCQEALIGEDQVPQPPLLHLSSANIDRNGAYLLDAFNTMFLYVGSAVSEEFIRGVFDVPNFMSIEDGMVDLPELENPTSEKLRTFISFLMDKRPGGPTFLVVREDGRHRLNFFQYMVEDRTESTMSYYEFLQHVQKQVKS